VAVPLTNISDSLGMTNLYRVPCTWPPIAMAGLIRLIVNITAVTGINYLKRLGHYATSPEVVGSILDDIEFIFQFI
jgi:hypothetical protein